MMIQNTLVILIILAAVGYTIYAVVKSIKSRGVSECDDCFSCGPKNEIMRKYKKKKYKFNSE
ncbi:hypothetical protein MASR2M117_11020 [Paludibacter sp.]